VYLKDSSSNGKDVLRVGKLNLVDLAGSENSKSAGTEKTRVRESANINKSLLTLGRVIQGLVDNKPHIPYRESKLTCILKDSLGGHTKTYIIATIAPGQQTQDEIKSTLDYASLAKDIINKPQANPPINRERHLDTLAKTIDQLYEELRINHEKHGVHMTKAKFDSMKTEIQSLKDELKAKEADLYDLKNKEKQHSNEKTRIIEEWKSKQDASDKEKEELRREKIAMIKEHSDIMTKMESNYKLIQKSLEAEYKAKEQKLVDEFNEKESWMQQEIEATRQKNEDCLNSIKSFRRDLDAHNNTKWESFMSALNQNNTASSGFTPPPPVPISQG
jgi:kinesin family protein 11